MRTLVTIVLLSCAVAGPARADERERALELFGQSAEHYREGRFSVAVELLREAYALHPEPTLLYNLARALEGMGELDEAIVSYERFLRDAEDVEDRGAIERRLETLRRQRDDQRELERARSGEGATVPEDDGLENATAVEPRDASGPGALPWVVAGVGVAALGAGVAFGAMAKAANDDAIEEPIHERAVAFREDAESHQLLANVLLVAGGVVAAAGLLWGLIDLGAGDEEDVAVGLGPGGVALAGRF
jgi:tetratricopeptide (TPR) repeat protein